MSRDRSPRNYGEGIGAKRKRWQALGLCRDCGRSRDGEGSRCASCRAKANQGEA